MKIFIDKRKRGRIQIFKIFCNPASVQWIITVEFPHIFVRYATGGNIGILFYISYNQEKPDEPIHIIQNKKNGDSYTLVLYWFVSTHFIFLSFLQITKVQVFVIGSISFVLYYRLLLFSVCCYCVNPRIYYRSQRTRFYYKTVQLNPQFLNQSNTRIVVFQP